MGLTQGWTAYLAVVISLPLPPSSPPHCPPYQPPSADRGMQTGVVTEISTPVPQASAVCPCWRETNKKDMSCSRDGTSGVMEDGLTLFKQSSISTRAASKRECHRNRIIPEQAKQRKPNHCMQF